MKVLNIDMEKITTMKPLNQNKMSTTFGIPREPINIELGDKDGVYYYINTEIFEKVFFRSMSRSRWLSDLAKMLPDDTRVYALDNTQQGVFTIGDIKNLIKKEQ